MSVLAINWLAVLVATLAAFAVGAVWYGPLFSKAWQQLSALSDEDVQQDVVRTFSGAFVLTFVAAFGLAMILQLHPDPDLGAGVGVGTVIGLAFVASSLGINYLFARKPLRLYLIDASYLVLMFAVMGLILGAWR